MAAAPAVAVDPIDAPVDAADEEEDALSVVEADDDDDDDEDDDEADVCPCDGAAAGAGAVVDTGDDAEVVDVAGRPR